MRLRRKLLGVTQTELAAGLGLTFQQVQKYERGANRVSASRLADLSRILDVPISFFFDSMEGATAPVAAAEGHHPEPAKVHADTMKLVREFNNIKSGEVRRHLVRLVQSLSAKPD